MMDLKSIAFGRGGSTPPSATILFKSMHRKEQKFTFHVLFSLLCIPLKIIGELGEWLKPPSC